MSRTIIPQVIKYECDICRKPMEPDAQLIRASVILETRANYTENAGGPSFKASALITGERLEDLCPKCSGEIHNKIKDLRYKADKA